MLVEAMVLGRQDRIGESGRYLIERNQPALLPVAFEDAR